MAWEALSFVAAGIAVAVSLAAFIATGIRAIRAEIRAQAQQQREDHQALSQQQREDRIRLEEAIAKLTDKVTEIAERTARIEGVLINQGMLASPGTIAQGIPEDEPRES